MSMKTLIAWICLSIGVVSSRIRSAIDLVIGSHIVFYQPFKIMLQKSSKRVGLKLDISAPQFIIPQDPTDSKTYMVVFDLGRLKVSNLLANDEQEEDNSRDEKSSANQNAQEEDDDLDGKFSQIGYTNHMKSTVNLVMIYSLSAA